MNNRFLRWYTPKFQEQVKTVALPILEKALKTGELEHGRDVQKVEAILNKVTDSAYSKYTKPLKKGIEYSDRMRTNPSPEEEVACYFRYRTYRLLDNPKQVIEEASKLKAKTKDPHQIQALEILLEIALDLVPVGAALAQMRALKDEVKDPYKAPVAASATVKKIHQLLLQITQDVHNQLVLEWTTIILAHIETFEKNRQPGQSIRSYHKRDRGYLYGYEYAQRLLVETHEHRDSKLFYTQKRKPNFKEMLGKEVLHIVEQIKSQFIFKNLHKVSPIVDARKDFKLAKLLGTNCRAGNLEGSIRVEFKGDAFTVRNQVVWSTSIHGTPFIRYPSTFHDIFQGGKQHKFQSEEWMNETFAKTAQ